jgi:hypothetical protein
VDWPSASHRADAQGALPLNGRCVHVCVPCAAATELPALRPRSARGLSE